jgi:group I intron endonuclease
METYRATNTLNGKFYIGSTFDFKARKKQHLRSKVNYPFQNALRKNPEAFEWEVWTDDCEEPTLEQALLDMWYGKEQCYNISNSSKGPGSEGGRKGGKIGGKRVHELHPSHVEKLLEYNKESGFKVQSENGKKSKELGIGIFGISPEERSKISRKSMLSVHEKYPEMASQIGERAKTLGLGIFGWSEEQRREHNIKASKAARKSIVEKTSKAVKCLETGVEYFSVSEASRETGINRACISKCCRGERNIAGGLHWKFVTLEENGQV